MSGSGKGSSSSSLKSHIVFDSSQSSAEHGKKDNRKPRRTAQKDEQAEEDKGEPATQVLPPQTLELHEARECTPCFFMVSKNDCRRGDACQFCHFVHEKKQKGRPGKAKRESLKKDINELDTYCHESEEEFLERIDMIVQSALVMGPRRAQFTMKVMRSKLLLMTESVDADCARLANVALEAINAKYDNEAAEPSDAGISQASTQIAVEHQTSRHPPLPKTSQLSL